MGQLRASFPVLINKNMPTTWVFFFGAFVYGALFVVVEDLRQLWELLFLGIPCLFWLYRDQQRADQKPNILHVMLCLLLQGIYIAAYLFYSRGQAEGFKSFVRASAYVTACFVVGVLGASMAAFATGKELWS